MLEALVGYRPTKYQQRLKRPKLHIAIFFHDTVKVTKSR